MLLRSLLLLVLGGSLAAPLAQAAPRRTADGSSTIAVAGSSGSAHAPIGAFASLAPESPPTAPLPSSSLTPASPPLAPRGCGSPYLLEDRPLLQ